VIGQDMVRVGAGDLGIGVDECARQPGDRVQQGMLGADGDLVGLRGGDVRGHDDLAFGPDLVADPAQPDLPHIQDAGGGPQNALGLINQCRVHRIHQPAVDLPGGLPQHGQDRDRDHQPDHRVGPVPAQCHPARAQQDRQ
jgi:hypothetical protein